MALVLSGAGAGVEGPFWYIIYAAALSSREQLCGLNTSTDRWSPGVWVSLKRYSYLEVRIEGFLTSTGAYWEAKYCWRLRAGWWAGGDGCPCAWLGGLGGIADDHGGL